MSEPKPKTTIEGKQKQRAGEPVKGGCPVVCGISVVVPVYNSEETLVTLADRVGSTLREIATDFELVLVNDGSSDGSWDVICKLASQHDWIRGVCLMRNYGQHNALLCGIREARYDILITLDDDLQNPPEEIPKLIEKLHEGYDVVYGVAMKQQHGFWRNAASVLTKLALQSAVGAKTARKVSSYRAFHTQVRDVFAGYQSPHVLIDVLLTWGTMRFAAVSVRQDTRKHGSSNYDFLRLLTHAVNMLTGFTTLPLRAASVLGFGFTLFGVGILVFVVGRYLIQGSSVPGFPFLASIIAIFSGVQLFALGIIGEYLARVYFRTMDRPAYVARCKTFAD